MSAIETYEVYAIRYATLARKASDNFIGGDPVSYTHLTLPTNREV